MKKRFLLLVTLILLGVVAIVTSLVLLVILKIDSTEYLKELSLALLIAAEVATPAYIIELYATKKEQEKIKRLLIKKIVLAIDKLDFPSTDSKLFIKTKAELNDLYTELLKEEETDVAADMFNMIAEINILPETHPSIETESIREGCNNCQSLMINHLKK
jgi:hypothetical protein